MEKQARFAQLEATALMCGVSVDEFVSRLCETWLGYVQIIDDAGHYQHQLDMHNALIDLYEEYRSARGYRVPITYEG